MRAPAFFVSFETADGPRPQSAALPMPGRSRMRSKTRGRWCGLVLSSLRLAIQYEYLESAVRVEHDLAVVAHHLAAGEVLTRPGRLLAHDLLEAQPVAPHHPRLAGVEQRDLVLREAAFE